ncbi:MAG: hypothetical protein DI601_18820 [Azospirillum brasilense]|nr:MAG: hypothetical protein DI601_18820 [Azospirillum brasilense]
MPVITEKELRAAMRDPRYTQSGHPESRAFRAWVGEGWRQLVAANETGRGDGQRSQVRVRPYQRQRNGHAEQVSGYTQSRASGRGEAAHAPGPANDPQPAAPAAPANGNQPEKRVVIFVGGAGDKWLSGLVEKYGADFATRNPGVREKYYAHDQADDIQRYIENLPPGTKVSVVGHSWGGNTAIQVVGRLAQENKSVDTLVTIDPVGSGRDAAFLAWARKGAGHWMNVNAAGGGPLDFSNMVAGIGGAYNERPRGYADVHLNANASHGSFQTMMEARDGNGLSAENAALGRWPATGARP